MYTRGMPDKESPASKAEAAKQFVSLAEASKIVGLSPDHLRRLAIEGKLWAIKIGRNWVTTEESVQAYLATNPRPGRKPKM